MLKIEKSLDFGKLKLVVLVLSSLAVVSACNPKGIDKSGVASPNKMQSVTETDFNADSDNLQKYTTGLEAVGLKFQAQADGTARWDSSFRTAYHKQNPNAKAADAVPTLKLFFKAATDYLHKYSSPFHLTHKDGTDEIKQPDKATIATTKAENVLVSAELAKIKK